MTIDKCNNMLMAKEKCIMHDTSGIDPYCNSHNCDDCPLCYEQGTMGEQREALRFAVDTMSKYEYEHKKIEKITSILKTAKADPTRDEYAEYYLDAIEEVVRWTPI